MYVNYTNYIITVSLCSIISIYICSYNIHSNLCIQHTLIRYFVFFISDIKFQILDLNTNSNFVFMSFHEIINFFYFINTYPIHIRSSDANSIPT